MYGIFYGIISKLAQKHVFNCEIMNFFYQGAGVY